MNRLTNTLRRALPIGAVMLAATACASIQKPQSLSEAENVYNVLRSTGAAQRVEGDYLRTERAVDEAQRALRSKENQEYVNGLSHIALRTAQAAEAKDVRLRQRAAADSLGRIRLNRLLSLSEAQRNALNTQQQLSAAEIAALRERNVVVSQRADSLSMSADQLRMNAEQLQMRNDSLRQAAEAASAKLNAALMQLRSLVAEISSLKETSRGIVISLSDILFDVGRATLKPGAEANVGRIAGILRQYPDKAIVVEGHTDSDGSDAYNQRLSDERAASVLRAIVAGGVDASKITSRGFGESQPVTTNATAAGKQQNRRVEVIVLGAGTIADAAAQRALPAAPMDSTRPAGTPPR